MHLYIGLVNFSVSTYTSPGMITKILAIWFDDFVTWQPVVQPHLHVLHHHGLHLGRHGRCGCDKLATEAVNRTPEYDAPWLRLGIHIGGRAAGSFAKTLRPFQCRSYTHARPQDRLRVLWSQLRNWRRSMIPCPPPPLIPTPTHLLWNHWYLLHHW